MNFFLLLDDNMTACIGDFGLARFKVDSIASSLGDSISTSSVAIRGTIGYVEPQVVLIVIMLRGSST